MRPEIIAPLITVVFCWIVGIIPTVVIAILIFKTIKSKDKQNAELIEKGMELRELKEERECPGGINPKRIVRCEYCGRQSRYEKGICPSCGAKLEYR